MSVNEHLKTFGFEVKRMRKTEGFEVAHMRKRRLVSDDKNYGGEIWRRSVFK